jgi:hypothetical protein
LQFRTAHSATLHQMLLLLVLLVLLLLLSKASCMSH